MNYYKQAGEDLLISVSVLAGSSVNSIEIQQGFIKVKLTTPPIDGKANKHLRKLIAKCCQIPISSVTIEKGGQHKLKQLRLIAPADFTETLGYLDEAAKQ